MLERQTRTGQQKGKKVDCRFETKNSIHHWIQTGKCITSVQHMLHASLDELLQACDTIPTRNGRELGEIWVSKVGTNF